MARIGHVYTNDPVVIRRHVSPQFLAWVRKAQDAGLKPDIQTYLCIEHGSYESARCKVTGKLIWFDHNINMGGIE